ncbi:poly(A) polymerase type 3 isoform X1 [Tetranychus urticae]|uniref:poly(A) polymerase type 3 isoform X1 n=1 Tax=Tetranychus urticae TaxID=32264 RepID=UPI00077B98B7|nr:poly(A) polymerase type 3 isoform X1 [Tetranychus urticae]
MSQSNDSNSSGYPGVSAPISTAHPKEADLKLTQKLVECLSSFDLFESESEMIHRMNMLSQINELVQKWIRDASETKLVGNESAQRMNGKIFTFGSFRLGVHTKGADIDTLLVAPRHIDRTDFFKTFATEISQLQNVEYVRKIEDAFVPVIKTKIDGIEFDILFARLALKNIPEDQDLKSNELLRNLEPKCVRSLNGCRVTDEILSLVPNHEAFKLSLRAIKLWAKRRGIYSNALGYLGGVSWAMLVARTCQLYPHACASTIVHKFFLIFSKWPWPKPVLLRALEEDKTNLGFPVWDPRINVNDRYHLMPIITPSYPQQNSTFNVTQSTKTIMLEEFNHALAICDKISQGSADWKDLFKTSTFFSKYKHFLVLICESKPEWIGLVESKIRHLVSNLERHRCIKLAHVNPNSYIQETMVEENAEPDTYWFVGLCCDKAEGMHIDLTADIRTFLNTVRQTAATKFPTEYRLEFKYVKKKELVSYLPAHVFKQEISNQEKGTKRKLEEDNSKPIRAKRTPSPNQEPSSQLTS